jgi:biopolymer transport protein ExbB
MDSLLKFCVDYKIVDICILGMGMFGLALIIERSKAFYFDLSFQSADFMKQIFTLLRADKVEDAITFAGANSKKPLAHVIKRILEKSDRPDHDIDMALNTAASEVGPLLTKRMGYLSMISNVVTLIGLLGTVVGLIMSFKAVSFADVSQKQSLLADGISMAMHATALGLMVAIPVMVFYSFLHAKQGRLFSEIDMYTNQLMEHLRARSYEPFNAKTAFPEDLNVGMTNSGHVKVPPPPSSKVS